MGGRLGVAIDAQTDAALCAIAVLRVSEAGAGVAPVSAERVAARASSGEPLDATRQDMQPPSKPVCGSEGRA